MKVGAFTALKIVKDRDRDRSGVKSNFGLRLRDTAEHALSLRGAGNCELVDPLLAN